MSFPEGMNGVPTRGPTRLGFDILSAAASMVAGSGRLGVEVKSVRVFVGVIV